MRIIFWIRKIPVIGTIFWLANAYAYSGDARSKDHLAPLKLWIRAFFWNLFSALAITTLTLHEFTLSVLKYVSCNSEILKILPGFGSNAGGTIASIFPNLLGLGIGIYALLFALDSTVIRTMHRKMEASRKAGLRTHGSILVLNADMAFPLCVLLIVIALGIIAQFFPSLVWLQFCTWVAFWYGLIILLEIVALLFLLIDNSLLEKIDNSSGQELSNSVALDDSKVSKEHEG